MKLYRSLIYRELKLTHKRSALMLILFLLLSLMLLIPIILSDYAELAEIDEAPLGITVLLFAGIVALTGGFLAGTNNGLQKADISSGWKRYSFVLPPTAKQKALSNLMVKLCYILFFGLLSAAYAFIYTVAANYNVFGIMLNIYLGAVCAVLLIDIAYSYILMFAKDKNQLKVIGVIAFFGAGLILKVTDLFINIGFSEQPAEKGEMISDEEINRLMAVLTSYKTTLRIFIAFAVICVLYFLVMWRSHERREP